MICDMCSGRGRITRESAETPGIYLAGCVACNGTGRVPDHDQGAAGPEADPLSAAVSTDAEIEQLLLAIPSESSASWAAWAYLTTYHSRTLAVVAAPGGSGDKLAAIAVERGLLAGKLRALLGGGPLS